MRPPRPALPFLPAEMALCRGLWRLEADARDQPAIVGLVLMHGATIRVKLIWRAIGAMACPSRLFDPGRAQLLQTVAWQIKLITIAFALREKAQGFRGIVADIFEKFRTNLIGLLTDTGSDASDPVSVKRPMRLVRNFSKISATMPLKPCAFSRKAKAIVISLICQATVWSNCARPGSKRRLGQAIAPIARQISFTLIVAPCMSTSPTMAG